MPLRLTFAAAFSIAVSTLVACDDAEPLGDRVCGREQRRSIPLYQDPALDLIFVIDRSPSMADEQAKLVASASKFGRVLEQVGSIDLRVAVITSELGWQGVTGCGAGGGGRFQGGARCGLPDAFLETRGQAVDLAAAFSCLLDLPLSTCPVSQPIAALVRALDGSNSLNDGFRRADAYLMVVIITDGDDCSLVDPGALAGSTSEDVVDMRCASLAEPPLASIADSLDWLRPDDPRMMFGGLIAGTAPRLGTLEPLLPERFWRVDLASAFWEDVFAGLNSHDPGVVNPCFDAAIDLEPTIPGIQAECVGSLVTDAGDTPLPWCREPGASPPCMRAFEDPQMCPIELASIQVDLGDERIAGGAVAEIRCALPCD